MEKKLSLTILESFWFANNWSYSIEKIESLSESKIVWESFLHVMLNFPWIRSAEEVVVDKKLQ